MRAKTRLLFIAMIASLAMIGCQPGANNSLAGPTWEWTASQETSPAHQSVTPDPENYTIKFATDGTVAIKADCNNVAGTYVATPPLDLTITLGASQLAACGDDSLDSIFLSMLSSVASYSTTSGQLNLDLANDAGAMQFRAATST